jgi:hypothetical protein
MFYVCNHDITTLASKRKGIAQVSLHPEAGNPMWSQPQLMLTISSLDKTEFARVCKKSSMSALEEHKKVKNAFERKMLKSYAYHLGSR